MKLLVSAYALSPKLGSEFGQGWNYCVNMSKFADITVLVGSSDGAMGEFSILDNYQANYNLNFNVIKVYPDLFCKFFNFLDHKLHLSWMFVYSLRRWNRLAFEYAKKEVRLNKFDAVHQLGPLGFKNPGLLYKLGLPSYLGPVGGFQFIDAKLAYKSSVKYYVISRIRNFLNYLYTYDCYIKSALKGYNRVSFVTSTNQKNFAQYFECHGQVISDQGSYPFNDKFYNEKYEIASRQRSLQIIWCGSVDSRKNINLLLDIVSLCSDNNLDYEVKILGDGPLVFKVNEFIDSQPLQHRIEYCGKVSRKTVIELMQASDVILFTSLSEANTATFFEALSCFAIPVALGLDGFSDNIKNNIGYIINPNMPYKQILYDYFHIIKQLACDKSAVLGCLRSIKTNYEDYTWNSVVEKHLTMINESIYDSRNR